MTDQHRLEPAPARRSRTGATERVWRGVLFGLAWAFLGIGIVGIFLPLLPGTVFLILSAACFTRSSPRFEAWLLGHPRLGPPIRQWRTSGAIPRRVKWIACVSLAVSWVLVWLSRAPPVALVASLALFVGVAGYILTRPEG